MSRTAYICIPGIMANPSWQDGWTDRAVEWIHDAGNAGETAEKFEYYASFWGRRLGQAKRATSLATLLNKRLNRRVVLTGHSNGTDIICRALALGGHAAVVNLVAPACERDFWRNGLNEALRQRRVEKVNVWISGHDVPMKLALWSKRLLGWAGLGYGTLGIDGPANIAADVNPSVNIITKPDWQHGTYWLPEFFDPFMRELYDESQP